MLGYPFSSAVECKGRVAGGDIEPSKILGYLVARNSRTEPKMETAVQQTGLVATLLQLSRLFGLTDGFDTSPELLDHRPLKACLPSDYRQFGDDHISGGVNAVFQIGHDVWSVGKIETSWLKLSGALRPCTSALRRTFALPRVRSTHQASRSASKRSPINAAGWHETADCGAAIWEALRAQRRAPLQHRWLRPNQIRRICHERPTDSRCYGHRSSTATRRQYTRQR